MTAAAVFLFATLSASLPAAEPKTVPANAAEWKNLFDGKSLTTWEVLAKADFDKHGKVHVHDGCLVLDAGMPATGARFTGQMPRMNYELSLEGKRVAGEDFFCGLTFPVGDHGLTLILGGWSGWVVGLSCLDGYYAIDNETAQGVEFQQDRWYRVRVRVTKPKVEVWLDDKQIIDLNTDGRKLTVSEEMQPCQPLGIATWRTTGAVRNIRYRSLERAVPHRETQP